ncbi:hypothetical protein, partial [Gordonia sp. (in: high G+C Gram-positive bacteria)]|uniref:hypothetical protein n=1 Tax=Gordonia sp. (in: high G+C Gram-positive bacteria) TaxID=84139 RepID=UPI0039E71CFD
MAGPSDRAVAPDVPVAPTAHSQLPSYAQIDATGAKTSAVPAAQQPGADSAAQSHPVAMPKIIPTKVLPAAVTAPSDAQAPGLAPEGIGQCTVDDPDGNGVAGFQERDPGQKATDATVLGQASGRREGDSWEQKNPDGTKTVYTIPTGNGDQTVDQVAYDKAGKPTSQSRVVSNGAGGFQQWSTDKDGNAQYRNQDGPGADVVTMQWRPGVDTAGAPPYSTTTSSWDGTQVSTEAVDEHGTWTRVDKVKDEHGGWQTRTIAEDGSVKLARVDPDGTAHLTGETDVHGTGWVDDGNGGAARVYRDVNGNQVSVATNKDTGSHTTTYVDPATGLSHSRVTDKSGKEIGTIAYDQDGKPTSGVVVEGGVRTSWVNGIATITHDGTDPANKDWSKQTIKPDGTIEQVNADGSKDVFDAAGNRTGHTDAPDNRPMWRRILDFDKSVLTTANKVRKGSWGAGRNMVKGLGSLVGIGGKDGPGVKEAWTGLGTGLKDGLLGFDRAGYDWIRGQFDKNYRPSKSMGDRIAESTNLFV